MACQQAMAFRVPATQLETDGQWADMPCLGVLGERTIIPQRTSKESGIIEKCDVKKWWHWPWPFRGALSDPEHHLLEMGDLLDLKIMDMVRKDPIFPALTERASSLRPRVEKLIGVPTPNQLPTSEPEKAAQSEALALMQRRRPLTSPEFTLSWVDKSNLSP